MQSSPGPDSPERCAPSSRPGAATSTRWFPTYVIRRTRRTRRWSGASDAMLTRFIRNQLIVFAALTLAAIIALGWFYLRIPSQLGVGQYRLVAELPASGGLYRTSNVTYRGIQIGRVTKVEPTAHGVRATLSIDSRYKIPVDASANVHSVSAIGEQYLDPVSTG